MKLRPFIASALVVASSLSPATAQQVSDLRLAPDLFIEGVSYFDPGFENLLTREVIEAPVQLTSLFSGTSQNPTAGGTGDPATDLGIRTRANSTDFNNVNRFTVDPDGPGGVNGPQRIGTIQYEVDLAPLEAYLTTSGDSLSTLDLQFLLTSSDATATYDIYLSYESANESLTQTSIIPDDAVSNYLNLWLPAQSGAVGDVINGTHKIVNLAQTGDLIFQTSSLLSAYNDGARKVNIIIAVPSLFSGRTLNIDSLSGIYLETDSLEEEQVGQFAHDQSLYPALSYSDTFGPVQSLPVPSATFDIPSQLTTSSQNQGMNPDPTKVTGSYLSDGGTNVFEGNSATLTAFGESGITNSARDEYNYVAWREEGDFSIEVKLSSLTSAEANAAAGLMVRESLADDSAHLFLGLQTSGAPVIVIRNAAGETATETLGSAGTMPQWLRVTRTGNLFELFLSTDGVTFSSSTPASASITFANPAYVGMACTSGSASNNAVAQFDELSATLPSSTSDIGLQTFNSATNIRTLSRFASSTDAGIIQWSMDLSNLDAYLADQSLSLDALNLDLIVDASDPSKLFDVYLSYTDPATPINLIGISRDSASFNYNALFAPAVGSAVGDIVNGTHQVLVANSSGTIDLQEDLLLLYHSGVRQVNLSIASSDFYASRVITIQEGSGLFIETSEASSEIVITDVNRAGNLFNVTVEGLTNGTTYHLTGSADLTNFTSISGTDIIATGTRDTLRVSTTEPAHFFQVIEGEAP